MEIRVTELSEKQLDELAHKISIKVIEDNELKRCARIRNAHHNTGLLLRNYHKLKAHCLSVEEQLEEDEDTFWDHKYLTLNSLMQNKAKTVKLMRHVDICLNAYEITCKHSDSPEERRGYEIIDKKYLAKRKWSDQELADYFNKDRTTINRNAKQAIEELSIFLYGVDAILID